MTHKGYVHNPKFAVNSQYNSAQIDYFINRTNSELKLTGQRTLAPFSKFGNGYFAQVVLGKCDKGFHYSHASAYTSAGRPQYNVFKVALVVNVDEKLANSINIHR